MSHWLSGRRVVVTRPEEQAEGLCSRLRALGAQPVEFPVIAIAPPEPGGPLDQAIARLDSYDWLIFTSVNGVDCFWARLEDLVPIRITDTQPVILRPKAEESRFASQERDPSPSAQGDMRLFGWALKRSRWYARCL